jgi:hypothetical protein
MGSIPDVCKVVLDRSNPSSTNLWSHSLVKDHLTSMGQKEATETSEDGAIPDSTCQTKHTISSTGGYVRGPPPLTYLSRTAPRMRQSGSNQTPPGNPSQRPRPGWLMVNIHSTSFQRAYGKLTLMKSHTKKSGKKTTHFLNPQKRLICCYPAET